MLGWRSLNAKGLNPRHRPNFGIRIPIVLHNFLLIQLTKSFHGVHGLTEKKS